MRRAERLLFFFFSFFALIFSPIDVFYSFGLFFFLPTPPATPSGRGLCCVYRSEAGGADRAGGGTWLDPETSNDREQEYRNNSHWIFPANSQAGEAALGGIPQQFYRHEDDDDDDDDDDDLVDTQDDDDDDDDDDDNDDVDDGDGDRNPVRPDAAAKADVGGGGGEDCRRSRRQGRRRRPGFRRYFDQAQHLVSVPGPSNRVAYYDAASLYPSSGRHTTDRPNKSIRKLPAPPAPPAPAPAPPLLRPRRRRRRF